MFRLETDRLILRPFAESDFDPYAAIVSDPEVTRYMNGPPLPRWEAWRSFAMFIGHWQLRGYGVWGLEEKATGRFLGRAGLHNPDGWPGIEVGWMLDRAVWGKGFATEAARAAMRWAVKELRLRHIISVIHPENVRSIGVAERLGMRREGDGEVMGGSKSPCTVAICHLLRLQVERVALPNVKLRTHDLTARLRSKIRRAGR
jgi:RimJ/RimL family protein N-acetyltransferase